MTWPSARRASAGSAIVLSALLAHAQEPAEFNVKGVSFGFTEAQLASKFSGLKCIALAKASPPTRFCMVEDTYAGAKATLGFTLRQDAVSIITARLAASDLPLVIAAFSERYGKPESVSDGDGTHWMIGRVVARARRSPSDPAIGTMYFTTTEELRQRAVDRQKDL